MYILIFKYVCACMSMCGHVYLSAGPLEARRGMGSPGAGVTRQSVSHPAGMLGTEF